MGLILAFFGAIFIFNGVPHFMQGICGRRHMTPFGRSSSPSLNVIWGWINWIIGGLLTKLSYPEGWMISHWVAFLLGGAVVSLSLATFWANPNAKLPWHKD